MRAKSNLTEKSAGQVFVISRTFDALQERVWQAWTEPERMMHWWGPKGAMMLDCKMDLRPSGILHYRLRQPREPEPGVSTGRHRFPS